MASAASVRGHFLDGYSRRRFTACDDTAALTGRRPGPSSERQRYAEQVTWRRGKGHAPEWLTVVNYDVLAIDALE